MYIIIICQVREAKYNSVGQVSTALMLIDDLGSPVSQRQGKPSTKCMHAVKQWTGRILIAYRL